MFDLDSVKEDTVTIIQKNAGMSDIKVTKTTRTYEVVHNFMGYKPTSVHPDRFGTISFKFSSWYKGRQQHLNITVMREKINGKYLALAWYADLYNDSVFREYLHQVLLPDNFDKYLAACDTLHTNVILTAQDVMSYCCLPRVCACGKLVHRCRFTQSATNAPKGYNNTTPCSCCHKKQVRDKKRNDVLTGRLLGELFKTPEYIPAARVRASYSHDVTQSKRSFLLAPNEPRTTVMYGVELECEGINSSDDVYNFVEKTIPEYAIVKSDGSLRAGYGAEIVSVPGSLQAHKKIIWPAFFAAKPGEVLRGWRARGAGIHIHISADVISILEHGKMLQFMNDPKNADFLALIAGRQAGRYCQRNKGISVKDGGVLTPNHYDILSTSGHTGRTYELRMFRSNVAKRGFFKNLEFTDALVQFAKSGASLTELNHSAFLEFIQDPKFSKEYRSLLQFLELKGRIKNKHKPMIPLCKAMFDDSIKDIVIPSTNLV